MRPGWPWVIGILLGIGFSSARAAATNISRLPINPAPGADLFSNGPVLHLRIHIASNDMAILRRSSRQYVPAVLQEGKTSYQNIGLHLKGSTGSFRGLDDKPALTLNFGKFIAGQQFHGLEKIHLNNSVEDPSYLNELLGSELFRAAGVPAPRVAHALVELNGHPLGLYVLKEGFTRDFLSLYFQNTNGNLYEPGLGHDVDEPLRVASGDRPAGRERLRALAAAAREPDLSRRCQRLEEVLDLDRFVSFMAMEILSAHRDGYCLARNNFRAYHDLDTGRILFFPQGMDQLFSKSDASILPKMNGVLARAVLETPEGRRHYRQRFAWLLTNAFDVPALSTRADQVLARLRPVLGVRAAAALGGEVAAVKDRLARRRRNLEIQLSQPEPQPLPFTNGLARLTAWQTADPPANGIMERAGAPGGRRALRIRAGPATAASWRTKVLLPRGRYRFEGAVCTGGVEPLSFGKNNGASLRVLGMPDGDLGHLTGDQGWRPLRIEFEVAAPEQEVELICELRASRGEAWFDLDSLRLVRFAAPAPEAGR